MDTHEELKELITDKQDIDYAFLFHGYTILVMKNGANEVVDLPLSAIETALTDRFFFRIHRSFLVNLRRVREMEIKNNRLLIRIRGHELPVARRRKRQLLDLLGAVN